MPFLAGRIDGASVNFNTEMPYGLFSDLKKFYYNGAGAANPGVIASRQKLVNTEKTLFGADFPPAAEPIKEWLRRSTTFECSANCDLRAIERDNAVRLLQRLQSS